MLVHVVDIPLIGIRPEQIWRWMTSMSDAKYRDWHHDHRSYRVIRSSEGLVGMRVHFDELLGGQYRVNLRWEIIESQPYSRVVFRALIPYPVRLELRLTPSPEGTRVQHRLEIGGTFPFRRWLDHFISLFMFTNERQALLEQHAHEEFKNLERLV